jgi:hypothetical protein
MAEDSVPQDIELEQSIPITPSYKERVIALTAVFNEFRRSTDSRLREGNVAFDNVRQSIEGLKKSIDIQVASQAQAMAVQNQELTRTIEARHSMAIDKMDNLRRSIDSSIVTQKTEFEAKLKEFAPKPVSRLQIVSFAFTVAIVVGGAIWTASRYPDRDAWSKVEGRLQDLTMAQSLSRRDIDDFRGALKRVEDFEKSTDDKLSQLLLKGRP